MKHVFNTAYKQNQGKTLIYLNLLCSKYDHVVTWLQLYHILQIKLLFSQYQTFLRLFEK